ncbi:MULTISPECIES: hypothetical protein [Pseudomonas]|uniref:hypothetical protein n=1 Tax=Pseudomonas TaxID=286 RepID=UPI001F4885C6|nr:hypothetical protein [Pseudomonas sputi]
MTKINSLVAVDWRTGPDAIIFFFKQYEAFCRFGIGDNKVEGSVKLMGVDWRNLEIETKDLCFGFTTTGFGFNAPDSLWLFYYRDGTPWVCEYYQKQEQVKSRTTVAQSRWAKLLPWFDRIIGVMWQGTTSTTDEYWVLLKDENYLVFDTFSGELQIKPLEGSPWSEINDYYQGRMITAVLNDRSAFDRYFYIFLTDNQYLRYEQNAKELFGPYDIDEDSWPGLPKYL